MLQDTLNPPHGGRLVNCVAEPRRAAAIEEQSRDWPSWDLTWRQLCDLELLLSGGFSPLTGFMRKTEYESVCQRMRLADGTLWPVPITLDVPEALASTLSPGTFLALRDGEGVMLAALRVEESWRPDRVAEAEAVFGTTNREHPGVAELLDRTHPVVLGGTIEGLRLPIHYDFPRLRHTPAALREEFARRGWTRVVAFPTLTPMHRAQHELTLRIAREANANVLVQPIVGMTRPDERDHYARVRCYQAAIAAYPANVAMLSLLPLARRIGSPREALWHALIGKNYGCTHVLVGGDRSGPTDATRTTDDLLRVPQEELGIRPVPFRTMVYVAGEERYYPADEVPSGAHGLELSDTELRRRIGTGEEIPPWFTFPGVVRELRRAHPPRAAQGFTVFFTGLSGSGKSTIANALLVKLLEQGGRPVTLLDGDLVRKHLSSELGFTKEHRDINVRRIGYVASEITKNGGVAICAPIAPYDAVRKDVRRMIEAEGGFVLVYVATPLDECERRDRKGLYAKARAGILQQFTGVSDPYEVPEDASLAIETESCTPEEAADRVVAYLIGQGYLAANP